jgi:hypothetical protein
MDSLKKPKVIRAPSADAYLFAPDKKDKKIQDKDLFVMAKDKKIKNKKKSK